MSSRDQSSLRGATPMNNSLGMSTSSWRPARSSSSWRAGSRTGTAGAADMTRTTSILQIKSDPSNQSTSIADVARAAVLRKKKQDEKKARREEEKRHREEAGLAPETSDSSSDSSNESADSIKDAQLMSRLSRLSMSYDRKAQTGQRRQRLLSFIGDQNRYVGDTYNGFFIDYLVRRRMLKFEGEQAKRMLDPNLKGEADEKYDGGSLVVKKEKLFTNIRNIIVMSYKSRNLPEWKSSPKDFLHHVRALVQIEKDSLKLERDVDHWMQSVTGENCESRREVESNKARQNRLTAFWNSYQTAHKTSLIRKKPVQKRRRRASSLAVGDERSGSKQPPSDERLPSKTRRYSKAPPGSKETRASSKELADPADVPLSGDDWKLRTAQASRFIVRAGETKFPSLAATSTKMGTLKAGWIQQAAGLVGSNANFGFEVGSSDFGFGLSKSARFRERDAASSQSRQGPDQARRRMALAVSQSAPNLPSMVRLPPVPEKKIAPARNHEVPRLGHSTKKDLNPVASYMKAVEKKYVMPCLIPFCTGHSSKLDASSQVFSDQDLLAVSEMLSKQNELKEVNLEGNSLLTTQSLIPFVQALDCPTADRYLTELNIGGCMMTATSEKVHGVMREVQMVLTHGLGRLRKLNLSSIPMGVQTHLPLCQAIRHHSSLKELGFADVKLNHQNPKVYECISELFASLSLESIDIGWNSFDDEVFTHIGREMVDSNQLKSLSVPHCATTGRHGSSVEHLLEFLEEDNSNMTRLDIAENRIDYRGALVLEAAITHAKIKSMDLSYNPLFTRGIRSACRSIARETNALLHLELEGCFSAGDKPSTGLHATFRESNPCGRYQLHLERPHDRAILRMLYRSCDRFQTTPEDAFTHLTSTPSYTHPAREAAGRREIPNSGLLNFTFSLDAVFARAMKSKDEHDHISFMDVLHKMRLSPAKEKAAPLFAMWRRMSEELEQSTFLRALSQDFQIALAQFNFLSKHTLLIGEAVLNLLASVQPYPCTYGGSIKGTQYYCLLKMPTMGEYLSFVKQGKSFFNLNVLNPSGGYKLALENCCDFATAERLQCLDRWENQVSERHNRAIVSAHGYRSHVRNEKYQDQSLAHYNITSFSQFLLPESGELRFDYASSRKPPSWAVALEAKAFNDLLMAIQTADVEPEDRIKAVKTTSHMWYLDSMQLRTIMGIFEHPWIRVEIFVNLSSQLVDLHNEKVFRSRFEDPHEYKLMLDRLGHASSFPYIQPEQTDFMFDLAAYDQRLAIHSLMVLKASEGEQNLRDISYIMPDGTAGDLSLGVPRSWETFDRLPKKGVFKCSYNCSPDTRNYKLRQQLYEKYCFRAAPLESDVLWWSSIVKCPEDVVEFVEFIHSKFDDIWQPFTVIDGEDGNGEISFHEFKDGMAIMKCNKFKGPDEEERIKNVYRYLDPSGDGAVSKPEWAVLQQIYEEIQTAIKEFIAFCLRTFGDLAKAWKALDEDGSGEIDRAEWEGVLKGAGFFGLAMPIFAYIDTDDGGSVSFDEFAVLHNLLD
eukprot:CAMPEP_0197644728 /NCGR_PEP_ID=MMETSP1338-20131121/17606_1 /TAXON_ID=43686 ORGANISM="Pelagodinium beii, Strain RCC1491" /NCGR_SAMPLE_ID=MMETSP1338 /ASSEMBLY_ACC=CAM_ASM_000754 /LENGTH=1514 /DNA_ID=CAMNT_0043218173 /DNA_START=247 /DNA_END=4791 /DNA_ORIENTATION=-